MTHDVAVIGAGPAGLAAAVTAADAGLDVALIDGERRPGGQYHRHHPAATGSPRHGWDDFVSLRDRLDQVTYLPGHRVWHVERGFTVHAVADERPVSVSARTLVIATGAHDRSLPFPGWDLPGVLTAGGAQALLKGDLVAPGRRVVVAGTGPFLLPVAAALAEGGAVVAGVYEANRPFGLTRHVARHPDKLREAAGYTAILARHRVPYLIGHAVIEAHAKPAPGAAPARPEDARPLHPTVSGQPPPFPGGDPTSIVQRPQGGRGTERDSVDNHGEVVAVTVARLDRDWRPLRRRVVACDTVAVGYGFTPRMEIPLQLGCATRLDADGSLVAVVDAAQRTSVPGVYAVGETTGVGGAQLAHIEGELAGLAVAGAAFPERVRRLVARRRTLRMFAEAMHRAHPVREGWTGHLRDDTIVCRCEEVTRAALAEAAELGAADPRSAKLLSRAGMGRCQARVCGYATAWLAMGRTPDADDLRGLSTRPIAEPITLRDLAEGGTPT
jgi:D-hydroxyproline dehydrogenase subunit alpha